MDPFLAIPARLVRCAAERGDEPAFHDRLTGAWRATSWRDFEARTRDVAKALLARGIGAGDPVAILGSNRPEWTISALGAMRVGAIAAGIYATSSAEEVHHVLDHAQARLAVVENEAQLAKVREVWPHLPLLERVVLMAGANVGSDPRQIGWTDFLASGHDVVDDDVDRALDALAPDTVATFIYTSGTTGPPKAVALTHDNLAWTAQLLIDTFDLGPDDVDVSYLPLSHVVEQMGSIHMAVIAGYTVFYCHDGPNLIDYLLDARPTFFFGVPRVWERFEAGVTAKLAEATGLRARIVAWARTVGAEATALHNEGTSLGRVLDLKVRIADALVWSKVRQGLGLDRATRLLSGAAPVRPSILEFFGSLGMIILEGYGQSEGSAPTTANVPGATRFGSVGRPLPGIDVTIADDGEILFRGRNAFAGYHRDPAATAATIRDGWVHTGDLGSFDADGYLHITGRAKDIIITSGGKNLAPANIEAALTSIDVVSQAVCVGDGRRHLIGLLTLEPEAVGAFGARHGIAHTEVAGSTQLRDHLERSIAEQVNARFARVEHIRNFAVLAEEFSLETGELTPTFKIRRAVVSERHADLIDATFEAGEVL